MPFQSHGHPRQNGTVLVPCLLFLSLVGLISLGLLELTRSEINLSHEIDNEYNALLAARCGVELGWAKARTDETYTGETVHTSEAGSWEITVTPDNTNTLLRTTACTATCGAIQTQISEEAYCFPRHYNYALIVAGNVNTSDQFKILGDLYVAGDFTGDSGSLITGDVHLYQPRVMLSDVGGDVISVDGNSIPTVQGEVLADQPYLSPARWTQTALKVAATAAGQYYSADGLLENQDLSGVVYIGQGVTFEFKNVTIHGVLVGETPDTFTTIINDPTDRKGVIKVISGSYLKVVSDPNVVEDLAILAPGFRLTNTTNSHTDALGNVYIGIMRIDATGELSVTGTTMVHGKVVGNGTFLGQSPDSLRDSDPEPILFNDYEITVRTHME